MAPDGKELFYNAAGPMMAVHLTRTVAGGELKVGAAQEMFGGQSVLSSLPPHNFRRHAGREALSAGDAPNVMAGPMSSAVVVVNWKSRIRP
jgi:hypothetical protein